MAKQTVEYLKNSNRNFNNVLDSYVNISDSSLSTTAGTGITTGTGTIYANSAVKTGGIYKTEILIDLTGLRSTGAGDIIGVNGTSGGAEQVNTSDERLRVRGNGNVVLAGDLNTYIDHPAADTLTVTTAGTERLRVTSAGKVGVNVVSPNYQLDVNGDVKAGGSSSYGLILVSPNGTNYRVTVTNAGALSVNSV